MRSLNSLAICAKKKKSKSNPGAPARPVEERIVKLAIRKPAEETIEFWLVERNSAHGGLT